MKAFSLWILWLIYLIKPTCWYICSFRMPNLYKHYNLNMKWAQVFEYVSKTLILNLSLGWALKPNFPKPPHRRSMWPRRYNPSLCGPYSAPPHPNFFKKKEGSGEIRKGKSNVPIRTSRKGGAWVSTAIDQGRFESPSSSSNLETGRSTLCRLENHKISHKRRRVNPRATA